MIEKSRYFIAAMCLWGLVVQAAVLVEYDISATTEHPSRHSPSDEGDCVAASYLTADAATMNYSSAWSTDSVALYPNVATSDLAGALSNETYMSFTVTADSGYALELDSLEFGAYPGGGTLRSFAVYSSVGGFAEGSELLSVSYNAIATGVKSYNIDLSSLSGYDDLGSVEFRFYVQSEHIGRSVNLSGITLTGDCSTDASGFAFYLLGADPGMVASDDWLVLSNYTADVAVDGIFDFSFLNDAPAGKYGAVAVSSDGHFEFSGQPGVRVRFRGVNLVTTSCFMDDATADSLAERLARSGYNAVRLHHVDRILQLDDAAAGQLDSVELDRLDYLFAALKSRGIYINIDLYSLRDFTADEMVSFGVSADVAATLSSGDDCTLFKGLLPFSDAAFDAWAVFADALLEHTNAYTGLAWMDDPALVGICPVNENVAGSTIETNANLSAIYEDEFDAWLALDDHQSIYDRDGYDGAFGRFLVEAQTDLDQRMRAHLEALGVSVPLTGSNHQYFQGLTYPRSAYDYVDNHQYWDHPSFPGEKWNLPYEFHQKSAVVNTVSTPRNIMPTRYFGKPFTVSEFNYVRPNKYRAEGGVVMSACAGLQDWDGVYNFDWANLTTNGIGKLSDVFAISVDPIGLLGDRVSALIFLDEQIMSATNTLVFAAEDLTAFTERTAYYGDVFSRLGLIARVASTTNSPAEILSHAGVSAVVVDEDSSSVNPAGGIYAASSTTLVDQLKDADVIADDSVDASRSQYLSETGQVSMDSDEGWMQVVAPRCELFVLPSSAARDGSLVSVTNQDAFCSVFVVAADQQPLEDSGRMLILHLSDAVPTGELYEDDSRTLLTERGDWPMLVARASTDITLHLPADADLTAWAVGLDGSRLYSMPLESTDDGWVLHARTDGEEGAQLVYEIVRE